MRWHATRGEARRAPPRLHAHRIGVIILEVCDYVVTLQFCLVWQSAFATAIGCDPRCAATTASSRRRSQHRRRPGSLHAVV
jgi:hypothetical protein